MILIITIADDLHALAIQRTLLDRGAVCFLLECDRLAERYRLRWNLSHHGREQEAVLTLPDRRSVDLRQVRVIWWRRPRADQRLDRIQPSDEEQKLINNDCRGAIAGILSAAFRGVWVSSPDATDRASHKLYQLQVAAACGFRVPRTLVSQSRDEVGSFARDLNGHVIVKPVVGSGGALLFTQFLGDPERFLDRSYQLAPAIYQEFIPGTEHIRLNCFGARCFAARIQTSDLDWRSNLNVPIDNYQIAPDLHRAVNRVLDHMNLAMGIIDLKRTPDGEIVWLEVNPQGQFLFLEGITGVPLSEHFADYLLSLGGPEHYASSPSAVASPPGERAPGTLDW